MAHDADHAQDALGCDVDASFVGYERRQGGVAWRWPEQALACDYRCSPSHSEVAPLEA